MHSRVFHWLKFKGLVILVLAQFVQTKAQNCQITTSADTTCPGGIVTLTATPNNVIERSIDFDGINDCIEVTNAGKYNFGSSQDFTVEFWIKTSQNVFADRWIVTKSGFSSNPRWQVGIRSGKVRVSIGDGSTSIIASGNANVANNAWHHIAAVFDRSSNVSVYVDGVFDFSQAISSIGNINSPINLGIGASSTPFGFVNFYDGLLDEVRIWNSTLTQANILSRMNTMINPSLFPNLIGYYDFNEGSGLTAYDCAANPQNGNLTGGPSFNLASNVTPVTFQPTWNTGDTTATISVTVVSNVTFSVMSGWCKYECTDSVTIYTGNVTANFLPDTLAKCTNSTIWLAPSILVDTINWSTGSMADSIQISQAGMYWAVASISGCAAFDTTWVVDSPLLNSISSTYSICPGSSYTVQIPQITNQQVLWFDGSTANSRTFSSAGSYWVTRTTPCDTLTDTISITIYAGSGTAGFLPDTLEKCANTSIWLAPSILVDTINWSTGSMADSIQISQAGMYWAVASISGCAAFDTTWVVDSPLLNSISNTFSICPGSSFTVQIPQVANQQVLWFDGSNAVTRTFSSAGSYWLTRTTPCDTLTDTITIVETGQVFTPVSQSHTICDYEDVTIQLPVVPNQIINWFDGSSALTRTFNITGNFWVTRSAPCDTLTDTIKVVVIPCDTLPPPQVDTTTRIFIPNVFTPNMDGTNEFFEIKGVGIFQFELQIFNRWGAMLFETNNIDNWWDGTYRGETVAEGVYVYLITYRDVRGKYQEVHGYVTVLR